MRGNWLVQIIFNNMHEMGQLDGGTAKGHWGRCPEPFDILQSPSWPLP